MNDRVSPPAGAWAASHQPLTPTTGHGVVVVTSIALAAVLVASSTPVAGVGLVALLMVLVGCGALVAPVGVMAMTWAQARRPIRVLYGLAGLACVLVLAFAVARIVTIATA